MQGITDPPEQRGIIPRAFEHIFEAIDVDEEGTKFLVQASYLEIYNEEIRDLLGKLLVSNQYWLRCLFVTMVTGPG